MQIAYLMTHYPRVALTFISREIDAMEQAGLTILPVALNLPDAADLPDAEAKSRQAKAVYLKASKASLVGAFIGNAIRHPIALACVLGIAIRSARLDLGLLVRRLAHVLYACRTANICRAQGIRHLHAHFGQTPATIAWFSAELLNRSSRKRTEWSFTIHGFQDFVDDAIARLDLKAASAAFIICISDYTKSQLCRVTDPRYWERFHVVRCGLTLGDFPFREIQPNRPVPRIISVARLSPEKGHVTLLRSLRAMRDDGVDAELQIIGAGPYEAAIRVEIERLGLADRVSLTGELLPVEVARLLGEADIFCLPSFSEGLPISVMEAMAVGVPVVSTWISGIPELAINGVSALTVPAGNEAALAEALNRLAADPELRATLARNGRREVEQSHDISVTARQLVSMFESVLNSSRADRA